MTVGRYATLSNLTPDGLTLVPRLPREQTREIVQDRDSMNMVSSSRVGGRRQLAAWGWGRLSRRGEDSAGYTWGSLAQCNVHHSACKVEAWAQKHTEHFNML
jgi:hypothetical protein